MDWESIFSNTAAWLIAPETIAYAIAAVGLAVHFGYGGLLNFGHGRLHGARRLRLRHLDPHLRPALVGRDPRRLSGASVVFAFILGIPTLRLRADYLAIVTIAAAEIVRLLFTSTVFDEYTNSADGLGGYHAGFRAANPFPDGHLRLRPVDVQRATAGGCGSSASDCSSSPLLARLAAHAQPVGPRASRASAKTRMPCARSARTSSPTRCRRSSSVASSARSAVSCSRCPRRWCPACTCRRLTFFLWTILLLGGAATVFGPVARLGHLLGDHGVPLRTSCPRWRRPDSCRSCRRSGRRRSASSSSASPSC